ncbi:hypothetical protein MRX96_024689 [Rhipicephalus microplus]
MADLWGSSRSTTCLTVTISALAKLPFFKEILKDWLKQNEIRLQDSPAIELCSFLIDCDEDFAVTALGFQQAANILSTYFPEFMRCHAATQIEIAVDIYLPERQNDEQISMDLQTIIDYNFNQVRQVQVIELSRRCALGCWGSYEVMRLITRFPNYMVLRIQRADQHRQQKDRVILNEVVTIRDQSAVLPLAYYYVASVFTRDSPQAPSQIRNRVYSYHLYSNRWHMTEGNVLNILEFGAVNVPDVQQSFTTIILKRSSNMSLKRPAE